MRTLNLNEAAALLGMHKETLRAYAAASIIPGCKPGRAWRFIEDDLLNYMRSQYKTEAKRIPGSTDKWRYSKEVTPGGWTFPTRVEEYEKALGLRQN